MSDAELIAALRGVAGEDAVLVDATDVEPFERGWRYGEGKARAVVLPDSVDAVSRVMALCHARGVRVQPVGANTGLVAATNPDATGEQVVLGLQRLNRIERVDAVDRVAMVEAGVTLSALNEHLGRHGLWFAVDLGADPQIGGMIATNTGGTRLIRYGDVRASVLGLEVVLADGTVVSRLRSLRKDNTGLSLPQLFVGTSGVYGVITRATLSLAPRPRQRVTLMFGIDEGEAVLSLLERLERDASDFLSAFEVVGREALAITVRRGSRVRDPFEGRAFAHAVLVEFSTAFEASRIDLDDVALDTVMAIAESTDGIDPEVVFKEQDDAFWHLRHSITEAIRLHGTVLAFDLSVPRSRLAAFEASLRGLVDERRPDATVCNYGHWGDGGIHVNLVFDPDSIEVGSEEWRGLQDAVYALCVEEFDGSYSAEHGVGPHNQRIYDRYTPDTVAAVSGALKDHFDPQHRIGTVRLGRP